MSVEGVGTWFFDAEACLEMAAAPGLTHEQCVLLASHPDARVVRALAANPVLPADVAWTLADYPDFRVGVALAVRDDVSSALADRLACADDVRVVKVVAHCPALTYGVLSALAHHECFEVRVIAGACLVARSGEAPGPMAYHPSPAYRVVLSSAVSRARSVFH